MVLSPSESPASLSLCLSSSSSTSSSNGSSFSCSKLPLASAWLLRRLLAWPVASSPYSHSSSRLSPSLASAIRERRTKRRGRLLERLAKGMRCSYSYSRRLMAAYCPQPSGSPSHSSTAHTSFTARRSQHPCYLHTVSYSLCPSISPVLVSTASCSSPASSCCLRIEQTLWRAQLRH